ncbi:unnamed protein product [Cuscuta europaea]|uniref:Uncharacterized protein n=1 Tax=Cuscuta europaea TaxID=41803 RepID=A0A9P0YMP7_CUSEU|nr:unnamed protein product [Cuscuta europaea]
MSITWWHKNKSHLLRSLPGTNMKRAEEGCEGVAANHNVVWDCGSLFYDSYEIVSATHLIERNMRPRPLSGMENIRRSADQSEGRRQGERNGDDDNNKKVGRVIKKVFHKILAPIRFHFLIKKYTR